jgi:hypothetical protein
MSLVLGACGANLSVDNSTDEGGNAEGYPGGDELAPFFTGSYLLLRPEYTCPLNGQNVPSHKYEVEITKSSEVRVYNNGCSRTLIKGDEGVRSLQLAAYNTDFLSKGGMVYGKSEFTQIAGERIQIMALCRKANLDGSGVDVVWIQLRESKKNLALVYWGSRSEGGLQNGSMGPIDINVTNASETVKLIEGVGLKLTIDASVTLDKSFRLDPLGQYDLGSVTLSTEPLTITEPALLCSMNI